MRSYSEIAKDAAAAQQDDAAAMDRILTDVRDHVYYTCMSILQNSEAAQDATQDVLLTVFTKLHTLKNTGTYIEWVNRITANACKDRLAKPNRELFVNVDDNGHDPFVVFENLDEQSIPDKAFDNAETRQMIVELINNLPDEQRMCVMLYYYGEMKTREIADALDVSEGTVKSRLNYARKALKQGVERLEKQGNIRLHGFSPIPLLAYCLKKAAEESASPVTVQFVRAAAGKAAAASGTASAAAASGTAGTVAAATAGGTAATIAGRVLAGLLSVGLLFGVGYGIWHALDREPPEIPEEIFASEDTPGPSDAPVNTPAAEATQTPEPETYALYGETYHRGAQFTVDQEFQTDGAIQLRYENDETVFSLSDAAFTLETEDGTFPLERSAGAEEIPAGGTGSIELAASDAHGEPVALTARNLAAETDDSLRIVFTNAREDKSAESDRVAGQAQVLGMRLSVDQIYTDSGMGKIVLRVQNSWRLTCFGGSGASAATLLTGKGRFETSVRRTFEPNADESITLYFDNAEGMPESLSIDGIYMLDDAGQPTGEASSVTIPLVRGEPTQRPTAAPTAAPTATPAPVWSEWSTEEPPADAVETMQRVQIRYRIKWWTVYRESPASYPELTNAWFNDTRSRYATGYTEDRGEEETMQDSWFDTKGEAESFITAHKNDPAYHFYAFSTVQAMTNGQYKVQYAVKVRKTYGCFYSAYSDWVDSEHYVKPGSESANTTIEEETRVLWRYTK
jgi:RNA polymerase sigma factor (sigma-70 family)